MKKLLFLILLPVIGYSQNILWTNQFDNSSDWVLDNSCAYSSYNIAGGYDYVNQTTVNAPSACTSPGTLAIDPNTGNTAQWRFETDPNIIPVGAQSPFVSPTASNGFLFINSDAFGGGDGDGTPTFVTATIATPIDLSGENNVVLSFSHNYRWWQDTRGVRVSGDNGTTWHQYELTNNSGYPNNQNSGNPEITDIDISSVAGGQSQVLIQFYYEDNDFWAWYWAVDDVNIKRRELNNIVNVSSWIYGENNYGAEYGRTPLSQLDANWYIGAEALNNGVNDQINVSLNSNYSSPTIINTNSSIAIVESDSTKIIESLEPLTLSVGVYQGSLSVSSNADQVGGANSIDNTLQKNFEVTNNLYSLDGIGLHPAGYETLQSIGSNSWSDASDGLVCATGYPIKQQTNLSSVKILIDPTTVAQSQVVVYVLDSINMSNGTFNNAIYTSNLYTLTSQDIANGYIDITACTSLNPGYYYVAVELFSNGGTYHIRIVDDATVAQPDWSSAIWYPAPTSTFYSNGNAFAIRINTSNSVSTSTGIDIQTACDSYTWIDGNTYTSSNNSATFILPNSLGCDSTVTLDLTLNNSVSNNITILYCQSYTHNGISYNTDNTFINYFTSSLGCDSILYTSYSIDNSYGTDSIVACDSHTWIDGNTYTSSNSSATHTIQNSSGCDSVVTLNLTINSLPNPDFSSNVSSFTSAPFVVEFSNTTPNISDYNFTWDFGDDSTLQSNNSIVFHEYQYNGLYDVMLIAENILTGCVDTMLKTDNIYCAGGPNLSIIEVSNNINVFPNPTNENINISVNNFNGNIQTEVYDLIGNRLQISNETTISLRDYARGIYLLKVAYGDRVEEVKVIKQ